MNKYAINTADFSEQVMVNADMVEVDTETNFLNFYRYNDDRTELELIAGFRDWRSYYLMDGEKK